MHREEHEATVAAFIRNNGITRCPTACALPTQATADPTDRVALQRYVAQRNQTRKRQAIGRGRSFWTATILTRPGE
jgi:hypothetical protein